MKITRREFNTMFSATVATSALSQVPQTKSAEGGRWNLLMITNDQHRADCLGCTGNSVIQTPRVDRLASEGALFERHYVQCPQCVPSRSALYTGRYPHVNLTPTNLYHLSPKENTLATILNENGYVTAAVGEMPFAPTQYRAGVQKIVASDPEYHAFLESHGWAGKRMSAERRQLLENKKIQSDLHFQAAGDPWPAELDETAFHAGKAIEFLKEKHDRPFFLHLNFRRPHHPFDPPVPYDRMYEDVTFPPSVGREGEMDNKPPVQRNASRNTAGFDMSKLKGAELHRVKSHYYGMISLNDRYIGQVLDSLDSLGLADKTIVVFNSDHGEMLGDHGLLFKGGYFYEGVVRVALAIRAPGKIKPGLRIRELVEEIDVLPTILELLGIQAPAGIQGVSLVSCLHGRSVKHDGVHAEFPTMKMLRTNDWKLVHYLGAPYGELYDLREDPDELTNLYGDSKAVNARAEIEHMLADWLIRSQDPLLQPIPAESRRIDR